MQVIVHDYETTGVNSKKCGVVQSAIWIVDFAEDGSYEVLAQEVALHNPGRPIPQGASDVHGVTLDQVAHLPLFSDSLGETFSQAVSEYQPTGLMGYNNTGFDNVIAERCGLKLEQFENIDIFPVIRNMKKDGVVTSAKLSAAYSELTGDTDIEKAHDAEFDLVMTCALVPVLMEHFNLPTFSALIEKLNTRIVDVDMPMPFGKHEGLELSEVPKSYRRWLMKDPAKLDPDLRASLEAVEKLEAES